MIKAQNRLPKDSHRGLGRGLRHTAVVGKKSLLRYFIVGTSAIFVRLPKFVLDFVKAGRYKRLSLERITRRRDSLVFQFPLQNDGQPSIRLNAPTSAILTSGGVLPRRIVKQAGYHTLS